MDRIAEGERRLSKAAWDFDTARTLHDSKRFNASAFYAQQSAEKAVKALLYSLGEIPIGHSVRKLLEGFRDMSSKEIENLMTRALI